MCGLGRAPVGHRRLCADGEEDGADAAGVWDGAGRDRAAQRRRGHVHPAERSHRQEGEDEGEEEEVQHNVIVRDRSKLSGLVQNWIKHRVRRDVYRQHVYVLPQD